MTNVQTRKDGDKLIIIVDVSEKTRASAPFSKSGKSRMVASTNGFFAVDDAHVKLSLNVITK